MFIIELLPENAVFPASGFAGRDTKYGSVNTDVVAMRVDYQNGVDTYAVWACDLPESLSFSSATLYIFAMQDAAASGNTVWKCALKSNAGGDALDAAGASDTSAGLAMNGTSGNVTKLTLTLTNGAAQAVAGRQLIISLHRVGTNVGDTFAAYAYLTSAKIELV